MAMIFTFCSIHNHNQFTGVTHSRQAPIALTAPHQLISIELLRWFKVMRHLHIVFNKATNVKDIDKFIYEQLLSLDLIFFHVTTEQETLILK